MGSWQAIIITFLPDRAHKEVLFFSSPFFEAALSGNWSETGRPPSMSSVITISQPPSIPGDRNNTDIPTEMTFTPMDPEAESSELEAILDHDAPRSDSASQSEGEDGDGAPSELAPHTPSPEAIAQARRKSLAALEGEKLAKNSVCEGGMRQSQPTTMQARTRERKRRRGRVNNAPDAVIVLKEERVGLFPLDYILCLDIPQASTFHDFLKFVYPQYACIRPYMMIKCLLS